MRYNLPPLRRTRHPVSRLVSGLLGLAAAAVMLVFGMVASAVLLIGGAVFLLVRYSLRQPAAANRAAGQHQPKVIEGEFVVIHDRRTVSH